VRKPYHKTHFPLRVDYGRTIERLVEEGNYDWSHIDISSELFSTERKGSAEITIELLHFETRKNTDEVLMAITSNGLRPADIVEILTFGATYPEEQRQYPIVARGALWIGTCGGHFVPCLRTGSKGRYVDLYWFGGMWDTYYRFAVIREAQT
jgi:hypothetical protein